jgi:hypothetical protein
VHDEAARELDLELAKIRRKKELVRRKVTDTGGQLQATG